MKKFKLLFIFAILVGSPLLFPQAVHAEGGCSGLACLFSWDFKSVERTEIKEEAETERAEIERQRAVELERLENEQFAEEQRIANEHAATLYEIDRQADAAIARAQADETMAQAQRDQYIAQVNAWKDQQIRLAELDTDKALAALNGQTALGLAAINEAGVTKRWAITSDLIWSVVLIVGMVLLGLYFLKKQGQPQTIMITGPTYLPPPGSEARRLPHGHAMALPDRRRLMQRGDHETAQIVPYDDEQW